jgi:high affinity sulfate transporter 1
MLTAKDNARGSRFPILQGVLPVKGAQIPGEILAGLTLAALAIPEVMGYTKIAGMPVITGLYTLLIPMALFAIFGSSRHLVVGADSATAAMLAAGLAGVAASGSAEYVALAGILALMAAGFLIIARIIHLGFLADFLSRTVLVGFLTGVGIQVALGQITGMLGATHGGHGPIHQLLNDWQQLEQINPYVLGLSVSVLAIIVGSKIVSKKIPGALLAVVVAIAASRALDLEAHGVHVLGAIPGGLPMPGLPEIDWSWPLFQKLITTAFAMFIVILAQSAATSRAYAARYDERFSEDVDLVGLGLANLGAGLSGTFVVNGSPTKTQMVDSAGGHSQLAQLVTTLIVLMVLLFLTAPLAHMPEAVLSAVVFLIGVELIDIRGMRKILAERPWEFWVALITTLTVVFWGVEQGIIIAIVLSLLVHTRHGYQPKNVVIALSDQGHWRMLPVNSLAQLVPGLLVYRFTHSMYYANAELLMAQVLELARDAQPPPSWFCIDAAAVDDVDFTAAESLLSICSLLKEQGIRLVFANVSDYVRTELDRSGLTERVCEEAYYATVDDVLNAFREQKA